MHLEYLAERSDICLGDDTLHGNRQECEARARKWSKEGELVAYVVAVDKESGERMGHRVMIDGRTDRVEGVYE